MKDRQKENRLIIAYHPWCKVWRTVEDESPEGTCLYSFYTLGCLPTHTLGASNNWTCWSQIEPNFPVVKLKSPHVIPHLVSPPSPATLPTEKTLFWPYSLKPCSYSQDQSLNPPFPLPTVTFPPFNSWFFLSPCPQWLITVSGNHRGS